jgi:beta-glucanase (GH16 family)
MMVGCIVILLCATIQISLIRGKISLHPKQYPMNSKHVKLFSSHSWFCSLAFILSTLISAQNPSPKINPADTPRQQLWIEAEDFAFLGGWQLGDKNTGLMGHTTGKKSVIPERKRKASTKISIDVPGTYKLWVRTKGSENQDVSRDFSISINSISSSAKLGTKPTDDWVWQSAGSFSLEKGDVIIELLDTSQYYARCDKLLLTTDSKYTPRGKGGQQNVEHQNSERKPHQSHYARAIFNDLNSGSIFNQRGGDGFDANSEWSLDGSLTILDGDLQMPDSDGRSFIHSQTGKPSHIAAGNEKISHAVRKLKEPMQGQVWFSFLAKPQHESGLAGIKLKQLTGSSHEFEIIASGRDLVVTGFHATESKRSKGIFSAGQTSLVLGRIDVDEDRHGERSIDVWVNPNVDKLGAPLISQKLTEIHPAISHVGVVMSAGAAGAPVSQLDEVILSNYPQQSGYFHVAPRKRHIGLSHIPVKVAEQQSPLPPSGYNLVFSDEFESTLDLTKWDFRLNDKGDSAQEAANVEVSDGNLLVHAKKQQVGNCHYTGGGVISKKLFVYGYYEARFKIPSSEGWHTSFWTMPVYLPLEKRSVEIDFCEQDSGDPNYFSIGLINHRETGWNKSNVGRWVIEDAPNMVEEYVIIASEFTPQFIRFYINGRLIKEVDAELFPHGPSTVQLSCIASLKKGDRFQNDAQLPSRATFDYVRVFQHPQYAQAEAAAQIKAVLPKKPLPPISERQRKATKGAKEESLD